MNERVHHMRMSSSWPSSSTMSSITVIIVLCRICFHKSRNILLSKHDPSYCKRQIDQSYSNTYENGKRPKKRVEQSKMIQRNLEEEISKFKNRDKFGARAACLP